MELGEVDDDDSEGVLLDEPDTLDDLLDDDESLTEDELELTDEDDTPKKSSNSGSSPTQRPLISTTTILILSLTLIGLALQAPEGENKIAFFAGCLGIVMFIGLQWTAKIRDMVTKQLASTRTREQAENRLQAHISAERTPSE